MDFFTHMDIFRSNVFCMDISLTMDIFLYGHYSIWTFYLMDNLQIHRPSQYAVPLHDPILAHVQTFQEYALACLGPCTVHPNMAWLMYGS